MNIGYLLVQLQMSTNNKVLLSIYWTTNMINFMMIGYSILSKDLSIVKFIVVLTTLRNTLRFYDFEKTNYELLNFNNVALMLANVISATYMNIYFMANVKICSFTCIVVSQIISLIHSSGISHLFKAWNFYSR